MSELSLFRCICVVGSSCIIDSRSIPFSIFVFLVIFLLYIMHTVAKLSFNSASTELAGRE